MPMTSPDHIDPYYISSKATSWQCENTKADKARDKLMALYGLDFDMIKNNFGEWVDKKYKENKPGDFFLNFFDILSLISSWISSAGLSISISLSVGRV